MTTDRTFFALVCLAALAAFGLMSWFNASDTLTFWATLLVTPSLARKPTNPSSDAELVAAYQADHDLQHIVQLMDRYQPLLESISRRYLTRTYTVEDIRHEYLLFLAEKLEDLQARPNLKGWLCTALRHWLIDRQRQDNTHANYCQYQRLHGVHSEAAKDTWLDQQWLVTQAMDLLRPEEALCVRLYYLEEYSYEEIAEEMQWTFRKVSGHLYRALKRLRSQMDRHSLAASLQTA